jgi:hypothetical protein
VLLLKKPGIAYCAVVLSALSFFSVVNSVSAVEFLTDPSEHVSSVYIKVIDDSVAAMPAHCFVLSSFMDQEVIT